jgi:hypothetical protein
MQAMFMIELIFLAIGLLLGCAMKQYKRSGISRHCHHPGDLLHVHHLRYAGELDFLKYFTPSGISTPVSSFAAARWTVRTC